MKEAAAVADHVRRVEGRRFACLADAETAMADYEGHGQGRPAQTDPPAVARCSRLVGEVDALANAEVENGWTVLATTVEPTQGTVVEILQAYQAQPSTVEPGSRWSKHPAAISPGGREQPARRAA